MDIILLEAIGKLGNFGDRASVKAGYARNYLIPQKKALPATKHNIQYFEEKKQEFQQELLKKQGEAKNRATLISETTLTLDANAHDDGKLYGSVGAKEIVDIFEQKGIKVSKNEILLPDGPIRTTGTHSIKIELTKDIGADVTLEITSSDQTTKTSTAKEI